MTNSTEIQVLEKRLIGLESELSNTRDNLKGEISLTRESLGNEISSIREYIKSQMDWIRPAIFGMFGVIIVLVIGVAGFIYDIKQEIGDMKQVLGGMKQSLQLIELTSELASELSGDKEFAFASENRKMLLIDSVSLENSNYQEFFPVVIHSSKSEDKPDSTLPVKSEVFPPDFGANDSDFPRDDANAVPLPHSMAFNQFPSFAFRHF